MHWTFDRLAPEHAASVAALAEQYAAEAAAVVVPGSDGAIALTTDAADARRGTVRLSGGAGTIATVSLTHAVFADTGLPDRTQVDSGVDLPIIAAPPPGDGRPYTVRATGRFAAAIAPAIRYVTTAGQQSTAGPGGSVDYVVEAADAAPRPVVFAPGITTQVVSSETTSGPYVDEVAVAAVEGVWPRATDGSAVSLRAVAVVYRTEQPPISSTEVPADAVAVGELTLVTDPALGAGTYRVASTWDLPGPGYYTAVWRIAAADQEPSVAAHLERDYVWAEQFATPTQVTHVPEPPTPNAAPPELALTGPSDDLHRVAGFGLIALLLGGGFLGHHAQQRRRTTV
ncbi:hypothetical protein [Microbacterium sp. CJ88]|uniref:hypothetical protein n=1 Tax=Microbacterium sp. CJ88 TaxID=3445672 RepID=UPI003F657EF3